MEVLFECDQCAHQEWRDESQEPWLCPVCGNMRWSVAATRPDDGEEGADEAGTVDER